MAIRLGENSYGKSLVRLLRVARQEGRTRFANSQYPFNLKATSRRRTPKGTTPKFCRPTRLKTRSTVWRGNIRSSRWKNLGCT